LYGTKIQRKDLLYVAIGGVEIKKKTNKGNKPGKPDEKIHSKKLLKRLSKRKMLQR